MDSQLVLMLWVTWFHPGGGDLEIFIRHRVTKDMVCLILMS